MAEESVEEAFIRQHFTDGSDYAERFEEPVFFPHMDVYGLDDMFYLDFDIRGKVHLVNFWAVWCPPCIHELPSLQRLKETHGHDGFETVLVSMDFPPDGQALKDRMARIDLSHVETFYMQDEESVAGLRIDSIPVTYLMDREGRILYRFVGDADWSSPEAHAFLEDIIANEYISPVGHVTN